ncbi:MAG: ribbon-helix-helix domain-containing protein [Phycisphaeraceae bacterium]
MTLTIQVSADVEDRLRRQAAARGESVQSLVTRFVEDAVRTAEGEAALAEYRAQVEASGMSDDELDALHERIREEIWQERQGTAGT